MPTTNFRLSALVLASLSLIIMSSAHSQPAGINYDESKVPPYTLPDPLVLSTGSQVSDAKTWREKRRPEVLTLFETHVYGRTPKESGGFNSKITSLDEHALGGKARRKEVEIYLTGRSNGPTMNLLLYIPSAQKKPAPAFLGLNFK